MLSLASSVPSSDIPVHKYNLLFEENNKSISKMDTFE
jgi:hypothetical protein